MDAVLVGFQRQRRILHVSAAPQALAVELGDHRHVDRIAHEVGLLVAELAEVELHVGGDEALGPGVAFERDPGEFAHGAARAVCADEPLGGEGSFTVGRLRGDGHASGAVLERRHLMFEQHLYAKLLRVLHRYPGNVVLAGMKLVVVGNAFDRLGGDDRGIAEFGNVRAESAILKADCVQFVEDAEFLEDNQRRREIDRRAR